MYICCGYLDVLRKKYPQINTKYALLSAVLYCIHFPNLTDLCAIFPKSWVLGPSFEKVGKSLKRYFEILVLPSKSKIAFWEELPCYNTACSCQCQCKFLINVLKKYENVNEEGEINLTR